MHHRFTLLATTAVLALGGLAPTALARHGADDPAGHHHARHHARHHGHDDARRHDARDDRGGRR